jgi:hypothetical protein
LTVLFDVGDFDKVAEVMHPRRRRQVSEAERERLRTLGAKYRFQPGVQSEHTTRPCVATGQVDPEAVQTPTRRLSRRNSGLGEIGGHGVETPAIRAATAQSNSFEKQPK